MRGSFLGLLGLEPVQKDLNLTGEQLEKVEQIRQKLTPEMREHLAALRDIQDLQQRQAKVIELSDQLDSRAREQIAEVLSREQMMRLYQIRSQVRGPVFALNNRWTADRLNLTESQKQQAAELQRATQQKMIEAFNSLRDVPEDQRRERWGQLRDKLREIREQADQQAVALLTAEQKQAFERMQGEKLDL